MDAGEKQLGRGIASAPLRLADAARCGGSGVMAAAGSACGVAWLVALSWRVSKMPRWRRKDGLHRRWRQHWHRKAQRQWRKTVSMDSISQRRYLFVNATAGTSGAPAGNRAARKLRRGRGDMWRRAAQAFPTALAALASGRRNGIR